MKLFSNSRVQGEQVQSGVKYTIRTDVEYGPEVWSATLLEYVEWFMSFRVLVVLVVILATFVSCAKHF